MDWLDTVAGTVKKTANKAYEKSSQFVEITKINYKISEAETAVDKAYKELGKKVYDEYKKGAEVSEETSKTCGLIDDKFFEIETLKSQIDELKNIQPCPKCNTGNIAEARFCINCGEKLEN